ncbi:hypothetical protein [Nitratidesulfovibrio sp. 1201_IL3209]|uniref:hypothetical protein n=1 Tax=Nitratidesulfovibrio sp. 1201_IL3209 TaxID=3084053 RepID=UPI002FDB1A56
MFDVTMAHAATAATAATTAAMDAGGLGALFLDKAGQYVLIIGFFGAIIWFLRFLYGPKGMFRDPAWDRWNDEARREEARRAEELSAQAVGADRTDRTDAARSVPDSAVSASPDGDRR